MSKEQVIKQAWVKAVGVDRYENLKEELILNGFLHFQPYALKNTDIKIIDGLSFYRPKSLQGIENNNGWIKIESKDDLPKEEIDVHFIFTEYEGKKGRFQTYGVWDNNLKSFYSGALKINNVTHYQPIIKPKPPIY